MNRCKKIKNPSHLLPHVPTEKITDECAATVGSTVRHIVLNRQADQVAHRTALAQCVVPWESHSALVSQILQRQEWLTKLNFLIGQEQIASNTVEESGGEEETIVDQLSDAQIRAMFLKWAWDLSFSSFHWKPKIPTACLRLPKQTNHVDAESWEHFLCFLRGTHWSTENVHCMSYVELAYAMILRIGAPLCLRGEDVTFDLAIRWVKKMLLLG